MKKKFLQSISLFAFALFIFGACSDDNDNKPVVEPTPSYGAFVLNNGAMNGNASSISWYNIDEGIMMDNVFSVINGKNLGDLGQDMLVYGSKIYITVQGSGLIYVTDRNLKIISTIDKDNENQPIVPRYMKAYNGKVYFTHFANDGYLERIDTTTLAIDKKIATGPDPDMLEIVNNKIYVANSGGLQLIPNNTVSIVDPELTSKTDIEVVVNPVALKKDKNNNLYLLSWGIYPYTEVPNTLQQIDTATGKVTVLAEDEGAYMYPIDDKLYLVKVIYGNNGAEKSVVKYYDTVNKRVVDESFIKDNTKIVDMSYIIKEPKSGDYYVTANNSVNNGDLYIFSSAGKLKSKHDTGSSYPGGVFFTTVQ